ncbi:hypothetical protein C7R54_04440 [Achromobacter aloeverae]|uniref:Toxin co-regulated pilus biosynthesis protein Q C-terminal domain-containing protein n=2 Tax=Achromobacter aloeverae TaxID=1750518 RepID=A0A4Q1HS48_9BURK|nr:hypothetical protein C7R54_04440 [Achromobacter aloeverae]
MRGGRLRAVARRQAATAFDADPGPGDAAEGALPSHARGVEGPAPLRDSQDLAVGDNGPMALPEPATGMTASAAVPPQSAAQAGTTGTSRGARARPGTGFPARSRQVVEPGRTGNLTLPGNPGGPQAGLGQVAATPVFRAELADGNLRGVLARWASLAGWTFGPEHWDVDVDIPLVGAAGFGDDFKHAVRGLVGATEMAERPLQPCFYVNRVLRVVPLAQACDRSAPREAAT